MKCDVIIPVGPGHENIVYDAFQSVSIAENFSLGPFKEVALLPVDDTKGIIGRSAARNKAVEESDADWVYFLDADDIVLPELFSSVEESVRDPFYDAVWGKFGEMKDWILFERYQTWNIQTYEQLIQIPPGFSVKIGHFVRREIAAKYPFNTKMNTGEDWEYYLRIWRQQECIKIGGPTVYAKRRGMHSKGPKSANGAQWNESVNEQLRRARPRKTQDREQLMINIAIGYDPSETVAFWVLAHSIMKRASVPVNIVPLNIEYLPLTREPHPLQSTDFS
jgi:hypothetical protein